MEFNRATFVYVFKRVMLLLAPFLITMLLYSILTATADCSNGGIFEPGVPKLDDGCGK